MRICLFLSLCVAVVYGAAGPAPVVLWSPREGAFGEQGSGREHVQPQLNRAADLVEWMHKPQGGDANESPFNTLVVLMNEAHDGVLSRLDDFPRLQQRIRGAGSSFVVPAVHRDELHSHLVGRVPQRNRIGTEDKLSERAELRQGAKLSKGHEVIMVTLPESHQDEELSSVIDQVSEATDGNYAVAMLMKPLVDITEKHTALLLEQTSLKKPRRRLSSSSSDTKQFVRMTPDILAGLLTGILLLFIVLIGFSCLNAIQTPSKFTDVPPPSTKEY